MWCRQCNIETTKEKCPVCGTQTIEDTPVIIYWCSHCRIPIVQEETQADKGYCPVCKKKTRYMSTDLRPVFPEERLLLEILLGKEPNELIESSVWADNSRYFIEGKSMLLPLSLFKDADTDTIGTKLKENEPNNNDTFFNENIRVFCKANATRLNALKEEAYSFVNQAAEKF